MTDESLNIFNPNETRFLTYLEQAEQADVERFAKEKALDAMNKYAAKLREMGINPEAL